MMEFEQRMLKLGDGKRMPIRLEQSSWKAVDWLADRDFSQWDEWCHKAMESGAGGNATSSIRSAIIEALLTEAVIQERADAMSQPEATGFKLAGVCWRDEDTKLALSQIAIDGRQDLGCVEVITGVDEFGRVAFFIRNKQEDCPGMGIATPFTKGEWLDRLDGANDEN